MNLQQLVDQYVTYRRSLGERFDSNNRTLMAFCRAIGATTDVTEVREDQVSSFLAGTGPITHSWHARHDALVGFYRYAVSRGHVASAPLPAIIPKRPPPFVPYIYSYEDLQRLLRATVSYQRNRSCIEPVTVRTVVLTLYGTGLRIGEALALKCVDVDLEDSLLTIRETKFHKTRLVPFGPRLCEVLRQYVERPKTPRCATTNGTAPFFTTRKGAAVKMATIEGCFRRVCEHAGIRRSDGASYQPRLHDLRHTAAVHRLTSWYRQGLDVQRLLPHLSVYLGHAHLAGTQVYLSMTPELLRQASLRFEHYAGGSHD